MKIAVVTDDGTTIAQHFGRARYYQVFSAEDGAILDRELRDRTGTLHHGHYHDGGDHHGAGHHNHSGDDHHGAGHHNHSGDDHHGAGHHNHDGGDHDSNRGHGFHHHAADRHAGMISQIRDVDVIIVGGMGMGARHALDEAGIHVVATELRETEQAVDAYLRGTLTHNDRRVH